MKATILFGIITTICFLIFTTISRAANKKVERQKYNVVKKEDGFEVRYYPRAIMASVSSNRTGAENDGNQNFRKLAGYIFGGNKQEQKIAMTAPVYMENDSANNRMSFVLPANYQMTDLPNPNDPNIMLHYSAEGYFACLSFGGYTNAKRIKEKETELKELLQKKGYKVIGSYKYLGYNAPWDIINRENDIIVQIEYNNK